MAEIQNPKFLRAYPYFARWSKFHNIVNFEQIGLVDPFSYDENELVNLVPFVEPIHVDDWVYNAKLYQSNSVPRQIWLPSKRMLLKIMRACIGIKY